jgi:hypothetical protein
MSRITRNSARCLLCGEEVESKHRHDYVPCRCGNLAVDGGRAYLRRAVRDATAIEDTSVVEP